MPDNEFKEWSQCPSFRKNGGINLISKNELIRRMKEIEAAKEQSASNLSESTLQSMAENKRKVDAGLLPRYVGGTAEGPRNEEAEAIAKRVYEFIYGRKSRVEY